MTTVTGGGTRRDWGDPDGDEPVAQRRRWPWVLLVAVLLLAGLSVGGYLWWCRVAEQRLETQMQEYRRLGQFVDVEGAMGAPVPDDQNAATMLQDAAALVDFGSRAKELWEIPWELPYTDDQAKLVKAVVGINGKAIALAHAASARKSARWSVQFQDPLINTLLPQLNGQRQLANTLAYAALWAHQSGDDATAMTRVHDMLALARANNTQPCLVGYLVAIGQAGLATTCLQQIAPDVALASAADAPSTRPAAASHEQVRAVIVELLDEKPLVEGMQRGLFWERLSQANTARAAADGRLDYRQFRNSAGTYQSPYPLAIRPLILNDGLIMVRHTTAAAQALTAPDWPACQSQMPPYPEQVRRNPGLHPIANIMLPSLERSAEVYYKHLTDRRLTAAALAIRLYAADHDGALPQRLGDLVPAYLPAVPSDPFAPTTRPIGYAPTGTDPIVYSVSSNGTDDGGSESPMGNRPSSHQWDRRDYVLHLTRQPKPPAETTSE